MQTVPEVRETWPHAVYTVTLGATPEEGGTRKVKVSVGGEKALPFHHFDGTLPYPPAVALEVWDIPAEEWPEPARAPFAEVLHAPGELPSGHDYPGQL